MILHFAKIMGQHVFWKKSSKNANRYQSFVGGNSYNEYQKNRVWWVQIRDMLEVPESLDMKNNRFKDDSIIILVCLRNFGNS